jgi:hypothetical protein
MTDVEKLLRESLWEAQRADVDQMIRDSHYEDTRVHVLLRETRAREIALLSKLRGSVGLARKFGDAVLLAEWEGTNGREETVCPWCGVQHRTAHKRECPVFAVKMLQNVLAEEP